MSRILGSLQHQLKKFQNRDSDLDEYLLTVEKLEKDKQKEKQEKIEKQKIVAQNIKSFSEAIRELEWIWIHVMNREKELHFVPSLVAMQTLLDKAHVPGSEYSCQSILNDIQATFVKYRSSISYMYEKRQEFENF
jgi:vacuolar-type H+-ATPase subunit I/STV1